MRALAGFLLLALLSIAPASALTPAQRGAIVSSGAQSWAFQNSTSDLYFALGAGSCTLNRVKVACASILTNSDTISNGTATDLLPSSASGASYDTFSSNQLRVTPGKGLLAEPSANNWLTHSTAPATQTTPSLGAQTYTLWVNGSGSATMSAGTATGCGTGTASQGSSNTFTITVAGTCTVTVTGSLNAFQINQGAVGLSLCVTTTLTCVRNADSILAVGALATAINNAGSIRAETNALNPASFPVRIITFAGGTERMFVNSSTQMSVTPDGTHFATATIGASGTTAGLVKTSYGLSSAGTSTVANGGTLATNSTAWSAGTSTPNVATNLPLAGYMVRLTTGAVKGQFDNTTGSGYP